MLSHLVLFLSLIGAVQEPDGNSITDEGALIRIEEDRIDAGVVMRGEVVRHTFVVKNEGSGELKIRDVKAFCGCTVSKFDASIAPGKEGAVMLTVDTSELQGPQSKRAIVLSNDMANQKVELFIAFYVKAYIDVSPARSFRVTAVQGYPSTSELVLSSEESDFSPSGTDVRLPFLSATIVPVLDGDRVPHKKGKQVKVRLSVAPNSPAGAVGGTVTVFTGTKSEPKKEIPIAGIVLSRVDTVPKEISFGTVDPREAPVRVVTVRSHVPGGYPISVTNAVTDIPGLIVEVTPVDETSVRIALRATEMLKGGEFQGTLRITTDDAKSGVLSVPLKGIVHLRG